MLTHEEWRKMKEWPPRVYNLGELESAEAEKRPPREEPQSEWTGSPPPGYRLRTDYPRLK